MWKFRSFKQMVVKPLNSRTVTILADGNGKNVNKKMCPAVRFDFENPNSPVSLSQINKLNLMEYQFPSMKISYDREDVVDHAKSIGVQPGEKNSDLYLDKQNPKLQVLPSFIFPFTNKILLDMANPIWMSFDRTFHGEHYIEQIRQLPPEGIINFEIKTLDVLDKGKGSLYCYTMNGFDENGEIYFKSEYQMYEVGTGGFNGNKTNPYLTRIAKPKTTVPTAILEFSTIVPKEGHKLEISDKDLDVSIFSPMHPLQHYSSQYGFIPEPVAHGRYTLARALQLILFKYGNANVENFKAAKVRFANPIFPGDNIRISTWKEDSRVLFQGDVERKGETLNVFTGGYIDFDRQYILHSPCNNQH